MSSGLYNDSTGLSIGSGLYSGVPGLWGGAPGLISGGGGSIIFSGASPLYALRRLSGSAPLVRVRRSSDNAELDIGAATATQTRTNILSNPNAAGAVAGTPGTMPTGWSAINLTGATFSVVATGTELTNGVALPYIDVRLSGTATGGVFSISFPSVPASTGVRLSASVSVRLVAGSLANTNSHLWRLVPRNAGGGGAGANAILAITPSATEQRVVASVIPNDATVTQASTDVRFNAVAGAVDLTLRIKVPNVEEGVTMNVRPLLKTTSTIVANVGDLDLNALDAFAGLTTVQVVTYYDQSSAGAHASQATAGSQLLLSESGALCTLNGRPTLKSDGGKWLSLPNVSTQTVNAVTNVATSAPILASLVSAATDSGIRRDLLTPTTSWRTGGSGADWPAPTSTWVNGALTSAQPVEVPGVLTAQGSSITLTSLFRNPSFAGSRDMIGTVSEVAFFPTPLTTAQRAVIEADQMTRFGPVATYLDAMPVKPDAARTALIAELINGLVTDGTWALLDLFYLPASHDSGASVINAKIPFGPALTINGTCTFTADRGWLGDGTTGWIDTNYQHALLPSMTQNDMSQHFAFNILELTANNVIGTTLAGAPNFTQINNTAVTAARANTAAGVPGWTPPDMRVVHSVNRNNASDQTGWSDGTLQTTLTEASVPLQAANITLLRSSTARAAMRISFYAIGRALSSTQIISLQNRVKAYLNAIGGL